MTETLVHKSAKWWLFVVRPSQKKTTYSKQSSDCWR